MIRAEEVQETKAIELTLPLPLDHRQSRPGTAVAEMATILPSLETGGIILSGTQVLWSCFTALSFVGLVLWAILKLWVYE